MILLCKDPLGARTPDPDYFTEAEAAQSLGMEVGLLDFEALTFDGNPQRALRFLQSRDEPVTTIYRGWMLGQDRYEQLHTALQSRGLQLINDPAAYRFCHHLPEWYRTLAEHTPRSVWIPTEGPVSGAQLKEALDVFGDRPLIVKDWVKSQKHYWNEACFIPRASDAEAVQRVVSRFLQLQGTELTGGLVFREFVELASVGAHSRSGMPLTCEYRLFFLDGSCFYRDRYWSEGEYPDDVPPSGHFEALADRVKSRFFTMDVAKTTDGRWIVVELGDGQVAGLPDQEQAATFYRGLAESWPKISAAPG
jgi:hypothetical protein